MCQFFGDVQAWLLRSDGGCGVEIVSVVASEAAVWEPSRLSNVIWDALRPCHAAKCRSAVIRLASPSSNASRCVFLYSPR